MEVRMATAGECREALERIADRLAADPEAARRVDLDRSFACHITDLQISFHGRIARGTIVDLADGDDPAAHLRLTLASDDLLALVAGELHFASAWASGRVSVKAGLRDLFKLRQLL
jgi:hypothetical protein